MIHLNTNGKLIVRNMTFTVDGATVNVIDNPNDAVVANVDDLVGVEIVVNQLVDAATQTVLVERSLDGVNWLLVSTLTEASFPAGNNRSVSVSLSDANGMPLNAVQARVRMTAETDGASFSAIVAGRQSQNYRG